MNGNILADIPPALPTEIFETLLNSPHLRIERIISYGQASPKDFWYDQAEHEWVILLQGSAGLSFADQPSRELHPGDYCLIPAHQPHRVEWTASDTATVWLAIHFSNSE